jgi:hypothetical protein
MDQLTRFYNIANAEGFSKDYLGRIDMLDFSYLGEGLDLDIDSLTYVKDFTLPGATVEIANIKLLNFLFKNPSNTIYNQNNIEITFFVDQSFYLREFFEQILNRQKNTKLAPNSTNIILVIVDENNNPVYEYYINGVTVAGLNPVTYDKSGSGTVQTLKVSFAYTSYETKPGVSLVSDTSISDGYSDIQETNTGLTGRTEGGSERRGQGTQSGGAGGRGLLGTLISGLNAVARTAQAVQGTAQAVRGAGRAIRGR